MNKNNTQILTHTQTVSLRLNLNSLRFTMPCSTEFAARTAVYTVAGVIATAAVVEVAAVDRATAAD